jgi:hypothetical protein
LNGADTLVLDLEIDTGSDGSIPSFGAFAYEGACGCPGGSIGGDDKYDKRVSLVIVGLLLRGASSDMNTGLSEVAAGLNAAYVRASVPAGLSLGATVSLLQHWRYHGRFLPAVTAAAQAKTMSKAGKEAMTTEERKEARY